MENLLQETIEELKLNGKTLDDVTHIFLNKEYQITKEDFIRVANCNYDDGYGGNEVAMNLVLLGDGFWLERQEYDGLEWWAYRTPYEIPTEFGDPNMIWTDNGTLL